MDYLFKEVKELSLSFTHFSFKDGRSTLTTLPHTHSPALHTPRGRTPFHPRKTIARPEVASAPDTFPRRDLHLQYMHSHNSHLHCMQHHHYTQHRHRKGVRAWDIAQHAWRKPRKRTARRASRVTVRAGLPITHSRQPYQAGRGVCRQCSSRHRQQGRRGKASLRVILWAGTHRTARPRGCEATHPPPGAASEAVAGLHVTHNLHTYSSVPRRSALESSPDRTRRWSVWPSLCLIRMIRTHVTRAASDPPRSTPHGTRAKAAHRCLQITLWIFAHLPPPPRHSRRRRWSVNPACSAVGSLRFSPFRLPNASRTAYPNRGKSPERQLRIAGAGCLR